MHHAAKSLGKAIPGFSQIADRETTAVELPVLDSIEHDIVNQGPDLSRSRFAQGARSTLHRICERDDAAFTSLRCRARIAEVLCINIGDDC